MVAAGPAPLNPHPAGGRGEVRRPRPPSGMLMTDEEIVVAFALTGLDNANSDLDLEGIAALVVRRSASTAAASSRLSSATTRSSMTCASGSRSTSDRVGGLAHDPVLLGHDSRRRAGRMASPRSLTASADSGTRLRRTTGTGRRSSCSRPADRRRMGRAGFRTVARTGSSRHRGASSGRRSGSNQGIRGQLTALSANRSAAN